VTQVLIKGGEVHVAPGKGGVAADILMTDGCITQIGTFEAPAKVAVIDANACIVAPALIDIHTHIYWGATALGVRPEIAAARSGTGTFVDAGSAGAANILGFREFIHKPTPFNTLAYLNISFPGIYGFSPKVMVGEAENLTLLDVETCVEAAAEFSDIVVGIKVRAGRLAAGENGADALDRGLQAAEKAGLPLMCHIDLDPPHIVNILESLRPGDILTHCCRPEPNAPIEDGLIRDVAWMAKERGVLFDIGHGMGGFSFETCRSMLREGFVPDLISSDIHCMSIDGPAFDALTTLNKLLALGVEFNDALAATTSNAAKVIGRPDLGRVQVGDIANLAVFTRDGGAHPLVDATGEILEYQDALSCTHLIARGALHTSDTTNSAKLNSKG
jgi:dihydroorotase